jgi:tetratricopeptide (TPR) repeat protein
VTVVATRDPTVPDRQRSLDRLLDWSLDLLSADELRVLSRLAVLADGFDLSLAEAVAADESVPASDVPELVWSLIDWSLVVRAVAAGSSRFSMLSTVRSYVLSRADPDDTSATRLRLATVLLQRLGPAESTSMEWCSRFDVDIENVRAVVADLGVPDAVARPLAWSIGQYHDLTASYRSSIEEIARCVEQRPEPGPDLVALQTLRAYIHLRLGEVAEAAAIVDDAAAMADRVGVPDWDDVCVLRAQGEIALRSGDVAAAAAIARTALGSASMSVRGRARMWNLAALAHFTLGDLAAAAAALEHELAAEQAAGFETFLPATHGNFAEALLALGDPAGAARHQLAALEMARSVGQDDLVAFSYMVAARFALEDGDAADAVRLQAAADLLLEREGRSLYETDADLRRELLDTACAALGDAAFAAACVEGAAMPADQAADRTDDILRHRAGSTTTTGGSP